MSSPHELKSPFDDPLYGKTVFDNFPEPTGGYHTDWVTLKIM
jgi:hypothetical protein